MRLYYIFFALFLISCSKDKDQFCSVDYPIDDLEWLSKFVDGIPKEQSIQIIQIAKVKLRSKINKEIIESIVISRVDDPAKVSDGGATNFFYDCKGDWICEISYSPWGSSNTCDSLVIFDIDVIFE